MIKILSSFLLLMSSLILIPSLGFSQQLDLSDSRVVCFEKDNKFVLKSINILQEEIKKRSNIQVPVSKKWPKKSQTKIAIGLENNLEKFPEEYREAISRMETIDTEGYKIIVLNDLKLVLVIGHDSRGVLYGVGKLLRKMEMHSGKILVPENLKIASAPKYPIRGHQLGYRPKTNSYDTWSPQQFDKYIRDLAIFGANSIEIMPPRTDDDFTSVHMQLPAIEMIAEQSRICDSYGMDVWMWYPNMGKDYTDPDILETEIEERHMVFKAVPRLDAVFVPGGDPGDLEPDILFDWLQKLAEILHQYHPDAKIWVSPQVFRPTQKWFDAFYGHVNKEYPWFGGVVFGPWVKTPIKEIRQIINPGIPIRRYPDITHSLSSQYPIPKWDLAFAITLGRECINPRPTDEKMIHNAFDEFAQGSISYSEGTNDDVNKFIWSDQDWDPKAPVIETLRDYARYFISPDYTESIAQGLMSLEKNIQGPLLTNDGVERTLMQWKDMESNASVEVLSNFRFQMGLIRAYFDAYTYRRLIYEIELEQKTRDILSSAIEFGSDTSIKMAKENLLKASQEPIQPELHKRCTALADSLFRSIGAQLTVEKHHAMDGRGNFIDNINLPLNDALWLLDEITVIENTFDEKKRIHLIDSILNRNNPGPGGFYDNFGSPKSWEKIVSKISHEEDPGNIATPRIGFGIGLRGKEWVHQVTAKGFEGKASPMSWMNQVTTLYDQPLEISYKNLDPGSSYNIRISYTGRFPSKIKLLADEFQVHNYLETGVQPTYEFPVPAEALIDGSILFKWTCGEGERGSQVSEIWLIKN
ncbi:MAG: hypothetical protein QNK30_01835 [Bacteroidales bacterium]|nr:hypothetical protein [Bacteroidales bacterium]